MRLLFVDDEADLELLLRQRFRKELRRGEVVLDFAMNAHRALELIDQRAEDYELIFTDINMPEMSGLELLSEINRRGTSSLVIVISAYMDMTNIRLAMHHGAFDYLTKPIDFHDLKRTQEMALQRLSELRERRGPKRMPESLTADSSALGARRAAVAGDMAARNHLEMLGLQTAGIAHDLKNPLGLIMGFTTVSRDLVAEVQEALSHHPDVGRLEDVIVTLREVDSNLSHIHNHSRRAGELVHTLLARSARDKGELRAKLNDVVQHSLSLLELHMRANDAAEVTFETQLDGAVDEVAMAAQDISRIVLNLAENACHAALAEDAMRRRREKPTVIITTKHQGEHVLLTFRDNGDGIPEDLRSAIFEPFFSTKARGDGFGLGLVLVREIVNAVGGTIAIRTELQAYTEVIVTLPIAPAC